MNNYVKPTVRLAAVSDNSGVISCSTGTAELGDILASLEESGITANMCFGSQEDGCDFPIEGYCKFTSEGDGSFKVFTS